ncbi:hypothetical protein FBQ97_17310, partial [Acidobacteria bacterium ACD]|nr:hypothetical protein [Acidobacteria bacterium ACD]
TSNREQNLDIWQLDLASGALRRLTDHPAEDWDPFVAADGRIAWSTRRSGRFEIWVAAPDGSGARPVTRGEPSAENPSLPADGSRVVFAPYEAPYQGIWKVRPAGSGLARVLSASIVPPAVSPDGLWVTVVPATPGDTRLHVAALADGKLAPFSIPLPALLREGGFAPGRARWLDGGRKVAWIGNDERGRSGVFVQEFDPGRDTSATRRELAGFSHDWTTESFAVSPDGSRVVLAEGVRGVPGPTARRR